jgi:formylglycine-generating enzyme required for sulfatase activity
MLRLLAGGIFLLFLTVAAVKYSGGEKKLFEPAAGTIWTEATTGMQFVWVPSGCFDMGSEKGRDNEKPVHRVCLKGFYLGKYEVTQAEYEKIIGSNPCAVKCNNYLGPDRAVVNLYREDAEILAEKFGALTANRFRLPSESEWEYACLAGGQHKEYCGEDRFLNNLGWIGGYTYGPKPVGGKKPNAWGLFDMMGNANEYVQDCWHGNYVGAPNDGSAWIDGGYCHARMFRGGATQSHDSTKATFRMSIEKDMDPAMFMDMGVRLVKMP